MPSNSAWSSFAAGNASPCLRAVEKYCYTVPEVFLEVRSKEVLVTTLDSNLCLPGPSSSLP